MVKNALKMAYAPMNHALRTGGQTVSWYRGPLTPYAISQSRVKLPIASPDQALAFDPTTGMFDASYAAAWTLGRMLALQDTAFSTALYNWKRGVWHSTVNGVEDDLFDETFASLLGGGARPEAIPGAPRAPTAKTLIHELMRSLQSVK